LNCWLSMKKLMPYENVDALWKSRRIIKMSALYEKISAIWRSALCTTRHKKYTTIRGKLFSRRCCSLRLLLLSTSCHKPASLYGRTDPVSAAAMVVLCNQRSHQKMVKAKSARYKHGHCYLKVINLNLGRRCGKTEIVCHWSFLMLLAPAQQSIQLLICHRSRWRLLFIGCHWWLLILLTPAKQGI
jgi:hypothetical protein